MKLHQIAAKKIINEPQSLALRVAYVLKGKFARTQRLVKNIAENWQEPPVSLVLQGVYVHQA